tara:strand:- start:44 stop:901 length:858 start_codon:yes stop_codon:yes gene_type:complete
MIKNQLFLWDIEPRKIAYIPVHKNASSYIGWALQELIGKKLIHEPKIIDINLPIISGTDIHKLLGYKSSLLPMEYKIYSTKRNPYSRIVSQFLWHGLKTQVRKKQNENNLYSDIEIVEEKDRFLFSIKRDWDDNKNPISFKRNGKSIGDSFISDEDYLNMFEDYVSNNCKHTIVPIPDPHILPQFFRWVDNNEFKLAHNLIACENLISDSYKLYCDVYIDVNESPEPLSEKEYVELLISDGEENQFNKTKHNRRFPISEYFRNDSLKRLFTTAYHYDFYYGGYDK